MNVSDSERVKTSLTAAGYEIVTTEDSADVILLNTCSVRERAEQKLFTRVGEIRTRVDGKQPIVGAMGCVAQLEGETLLDREQKIDFVVGTQATGRVADLIAEFTDKRRGVADLGGREDEYDWLVAPTQRQSPYIAFVPIIEGCNKFCTYCIVPFSRGRERSRPAVQIVAEVERLRDEGVKEIHLIGQNVNSYRPKQTDGLENFRGATPFAKLLRAVAATGMERIKFTTSFPRDFHADIVAAINEHENLCNWVHLPVQSGSNRVLKLMRRGHVVDSYLRHVEAIKQSPRQISLTSDIIVGFPGETEEDFADTVRLVDRCEYDSLYIFKYSPRPGTPAAKVVDDVSASDKQRRFLELEQVQRRNQKVIFENHRGRVLEVLAEKVSVKSENDLNGHSTCQKVVNFTADKANLGKVLQVQVTEAKSNSLYGVLVN